MRTFSILRAVVLAAALSAPMAQAAFAMQQEQQALSSQTVASSVDSPYDAPQFAFGN